MKKLFTLILIIILLLTSCSIDFGDGISGVFQNSRTRLLDAMTSREEKAFRELFDTLFIAMDNDDKNGIKNLFSPAAINEIPDLDSKIEAFLSVYNGPMEIENIKYSAGYGSDDIEYGKRQTRLHNSDTTIIADGIRYHIGVVLYSQDDFNKDNEGVHILEFSTDEAYDSKYYASHISYKAGPGFYYQHSAEIRDDIKWIEGSPWDYTPYDRTLTAEEIRVVVEHNNDYKNLVAVIGEPNCSWTEYKFYYYELENGFFAVIKLDNTTWERGSRQIENPDAIVAVYIADETEDIETVWTSDNFVKLAGLYRYYTPFDRELTEEFFRSFALRSDSFDQLTNEIGLPNVDETWYAYFQLSDNRFVGCNYYGDSIEEIFVYDSENRLYTIWKKGD